MTGMRYIEGVGDKGIWLIDGEATTYIVSEAKPAVDIDAHLRIALQDGRSSREIDTLLDARNVLVVTR